MKMTSLDKVAWFLTVIGAINWGLVGAFGYNLVEMIFGSGTFTTWVYLAVGVSGFYSLWKMFSMKK